MSVSLVEGKNGTWYPPFPVLGLASNGRDIFMMGGGGGSRATKEVPNLVLAFRYNDFTGRPTPVASVNTGVKCVAFLSHCPANGLWLASCGKGCKILSLDAGSGTINDHCEWETESTGRDPSQNVAVFSPKGDIVATGGTDGSICLWTASALPQVPALAFRCMVPREVSDVAWSPDGATLASADKSGFCRLWDPSSGTEKSSFQYDAKGSKVPIMIRGVRFIKVADVGTKLLVLACGGKGPGYLAIYGLDGRKAAEVCVDKLPLSSMAVDVQERFVAVLLCTGGKRIYSLPQLRLVRATQKPVHELPAPCSAFVGDCTVASGSGDRSVHFLRARPPVVPGGSKEGCASLTCCFVTLVIVLVHLYLLAHIGARSAALSQGRFG